MPSSHYYTCCIVNCLIGTRLVISTQFKRGTTQFVLFLWNLIMINFLTKLSINNLTRFFCLIFNQTICVFSWIEEEKNRKVVYKEHCGSCTQGVPNNFHVPYGLSIYVCMYVMFIIVCIMCELRNLIKILWTPFVSEISHFSSETRGKNRHKEINCIQLDKNCSQRALCHEQ